MSFVDAINLKLAKKYAGTGMVYTVTEENCEIVKIACELTMEKIMERIESIVDKRVAHGIWMERMVASRVKVKVIDDKKITKGGG